MYYPIGWHKVLKLDIQSNQEQCNILSVQANHERELYFILTTSSIHIWNPRPAVEIVCHRRSEESIKRIGYNRTAIWKTDSSVIVVATERDQLLFYQLRRRDSSTLSSGTFLLSSARINDSIFNLRQDLKNNVRLQRSDTNPEPLKIPDSTDFVPALTIFSFGKLDLRAIGISCLMSAEEEIIVGARNGNIYGVHWDGNVDNKFPWSLSKDIRKDSDYLVDIKFSSVILGFALVFRSGRVAFMPLKRNKTKLLDANSNETDEQQDDATKHNVPSTSKANFSNEIKNACCAEVNHKYRLVAIGLKSSTIVICNVDDANSSLAINHKLEIGQSKYAHGINHLGPVKCVTYSPDSFALVTSWQGGEFAIWSVFGALLFQSQQWKLESQVNNFIDSAIFSSLAWGREGYSLWLCSTSTESDTDSQSSTSDSASVSACPQLIIGQGSPNAKSNIKAETQEVIIMSIAHSSLTSSPHLTCCSDAIILMSEDRLYVGPSTPHGDKFDHWILIDIPQPYLSKNFPLRFATVDRDCKNIAISGNYGFSIYSMESNKWKFFHKKTHENSFSLCGDMIWWNSYLVMSCFNVDTENFELRAYLTTGAHLDNELSIIQTTRMEIIRLSIFENRLLVLYSDGTMGMFMLNLRWRPTFRKTSTSKSTSNSLSRSNSSASTKHDETTSNEIAPSPKSTRSDSIMSFKYPKLQKNSSSTTTSKDFSLQISPIENLIISNLQATAYCISSIALTRLHFKNDRFDDSILLNACGKLFLLEREVPPDPLNKESKSPNSNLSCCSAEFNDLSLDGLKSTSELDSRVNSALRQPNSIHLASASLKNTSKPSALLNVTFKVVSVIATNVEQFWISPEISNAPETSYFKKSLWLSCGGPNNYLQVWLPLLNDKNDTPSHLYVPDRIMLPIRCDIYPLAIRSSAPDIVEPDDAIVLGAESDILYRDSKLFTHFPYSTVKRQCRVYLHRILRELLLNQHLGYYARKIAESCQSLPYFAHCFELLLHEVLEEEATSPVPLPDPMLPQIVKFIKEFPVYLDTVVHCARKSELSMWSYLFDERAVGNPRRLFQECLEKHKLDTAASCLIILQSLDKNIVSQRMVRELIKAAKDDPKFNYLIEDLESFLSRAELDYTTSGGSGSGSPST